MDFDTNFLLHRIIEQNEALIRQNEELLKQNRLLLPICELPLTEEEKDYLASRGAKNLSSLLSPGFFDAAEVKQWQGIIKFLRDWGYDPRIPDDMKIEEMDFSIRTRNALCRSRIYYLSELLGMSEKEIKKVRNLGVGSIAEIRAKLNQLGYDW
ncbi:hypothetical protein J6W91_01630 [Candidatus Saccharibacteria bacterium]|nr:hypothetical protein [Candidatus Saccharibacteria bacterium]